MAMSCHLFIRFVYCFWCCFMLPMASIFQLYHLMLCLLCCSHFFLLFNAFYDYAMSFDYVCVVFAVVVLCVGWLPLSHNISGRVCRLAAQFL